MNLPPSSLFAVLETLSGVGAAGLSIVGIVVVILTLASIWASRYTKVGPNQVLIVSGRRHLISDGVDGRPRSAASAS